jgi:hypothetical protein
MPTVHARAIVRAVEILGGVDEFAKRANVSPYDISLWSSGKSMPPMDVFLFAVDVISQRAAVALDNPPGERSTR